MGVYKRTGSKNYLMEFHVNGVRYRKTTGATKRLEALQIEQEYRAEILKQVRTGRRTMLLDEAIEKYFLDVLQPRNPKAATAKKAVDQLKLILKFFGPVPLEEVTSARISDWVSDMLRRGLKASTVNRNLTNLRAILRKAAGPWEALEKPPRIDMQREGPLKERFLSEEEIIRLLDECPPHLKRFVLFMVDTGARLGEATNLKWREVTLEEDRGQVRFTITKTGKTRPVPLTKRVKEMLEDLKPEDAQPDDRVFLWEHPTKGMVPFTSPRSAWRAAKDRAGLPEVRFHDLRHTYASRLVQRGVGIIHVSKLLGHASVTMTMRYAALRSTDLDAAVAVLD